MSLNYITNAALARRLDFSPVGSVPQGLHEIAAAANTPPTAPTGTSPPTSLQSSPPPVSSTSADTVTTALHVICGYIPTEILTLYVAVVTVIHHPDKVTHVDWNVLWSFLVATPVVVWLVYATKVKQAGKALPAAPRKWPLWEMSAAGIAFWAWAYALPNSPFADCSWYSSAAAGIIVLVTSTILGLLAPLFQRPIDA
jgi:hypothetical protein